PVSEKSSLEQASEKQEEALHPGSGLILLVEDDELIRNSVSGFLTECGYEVLEAENGSQAVEYFQQRHQDIRLTILDMLMPVMSGEEAVWQIKKIDPEPVILLTSGFSQDPRVKSLLDNAVDGFLQKPFSMYDLATKLQDLLKQ
ncbi:MAG: response regulator, partial [Thermodesulfobacteriota bacterium]